MQDLMKGKRGLIMGVANDHSIAWGIAKTLTRRAPSLPSPIRAKRSASASSRWRSRSVPILVLPCDVEDIASVDAVFAALREKWGGLDFLVHAIAFSDKNELKGRYADTTRENFSRTMLISCFSFTEIARRAAELMPDTGGAMITLTFGGSTRVMPNYNVMGVAKAALEASVRYLAADFGPRGIRVNAISAGPVRTLAGSGIGDARAMFAFQQKHSPLGRGVTLDELGGSALYLLSDLVRRRHRRDPLRRFRLQRHLDAAAGRAEGGVSDALPSTASARGLRERGPMTDSASHRADLHGVHSRNAPVTITPPRSSPRAGTPGAPCSARYRRRMTAATASS